jgi:uncharacterized protein (DUF58 family)
MESLLDPSFLSLLEYLNIVTRASFFSHFAADRVSKKFGAGTEFADFRAYVPGDDYRHIDWAAYARRNTLSIKLFAEEQALSIYLLIDASRSMTTGKPDKLLFAKKVAAALGYIGISNEDLVTVLPFDDRLRQESRLFQWRGQLMSLLDFIENIEGAGVTNLTRSVEELAKRHTKRGLVVLLSDYLDPQGYENALRILYHYHFDLLALQINSPEEIDPLLAGDLDLVDSETAERVTICMTPQLITEYKERFARHYLRLKELCQIMRRGYFAVSTASPIGELIFDVFRHGGFLR